MICFFLLLVLSQSGNRILQGSIEGAEKLLTLPLEAGRLVTARLDHERGPLQLRLLDPEGNLVFARGVQAHESTIPFWLETGAGGSWLLELTGGTNGVTKYRLSLEIASPTDNSRADLAAFALEQRARTTSGMYLWNQAISAWRERGNRVRSAICRAALSEQMAGNKLVQDAFEQQALAARVLRAESAVFPAIGAHLQLAALCEKLTRLPRADQALATAIALADTSGSNWWRAHTRFRAGLFHQGRDNYQRALRLLASAGDLFAEAGDRGGQAAVMLEMAAPLIMLNKLAEARSYGERAVRLSSQLGNQELANSARFELAWIHHREGNDKKAIRQFQALIKTHRSGGNPLEAANVLDRLSIIHRKNGDNERALDGARAALLIYKDQKRPLWAAVERNNLAHIHGAMGHYQRSCELARSVLPLFEEKHLHSAVAAAYRVLARGTQALGDGETALTHMEASIAALGRIRAATTNPDLTRFFARERREYGDLYVDLLMAEHLRLPEAGFARRALLFLEEDRARSLRRALRTRASEKGAPAHLTAEQVRLAERVQQLERAGHGKAELLDGLARLERVRTQIHEAISHKDLLPEPDPFAIGVRLRDSNSLLLSWHLGEQASFLWLLDGVRLQVFTLAPRKRFDDLCRSFHNLVADPAQLGNYLQRNAVARRLGNLLLAPVSEQIKGKRLLLVADGPLHHIPFSALIEPASQEPLVLGHELVMLPSASIGLLLVDRAERQAVYTKTLAVIADPHYTDPGQEGSLRPDPRRAADDLGLTAFGRLPHTRREGEQILAMVDSKRADDFFGDRANRERVLAMGPLDYQIVHIAAHGILHPELPQLSGVVLSPRDEAGRARDGFVRAYEWERLGLRAELMTLSACDSARGTLYGGEGVWGLSQSLLAGGCNRVLVSLWQVRDQATAELMAHFYKNLLETRLGPAAALRGAQRAMLKSKDYHGPYYWAAFVLKGAPGGFTLP